MATTEITGAEEVAWDLSDLYESPDDPKLEEEVADAERSADAFRERYHGKVAELDAAGLAEAVAERERIESEIDRALTFAHLRFATNMADPTRGAARRPPAGARRRARDEAPLLRARVGRARGRAAPRRCSRSRRSTTGAIT